MKESRGYQGGGRREIKVEKFCFGARLWAADFEDPLYGVKNNGYQ